jgi:hypothetical protein
MQDEGLYFISEGLDTLKNLAEDMNEVFCSQMRELLSVCCRP